MIVLPDARAPAFPDEPYSAYCRVCWNPVYTLWVDEGDHHGGMCCMGAKAATNCRNAMAFEVNRATLRKALEGGAPLP